MILKLHVTVFMPKVACPLLWRSRFLLIDTHLISKTENEEPADSSEGNGLI